MSGGYFDDRQEGIDEIANELERIIKYNGVKGITNPDDWETDRAIYDEDGFEIGYDHNFPQPVIAEFEKGLTTLRRAAVYANCIDNLLSVNHGEDTFCQNIEEGLRAIDNTVSG